MKKICTGENIIMKKRFLLIVSTLLLCIVLSSCQNKDIVLSTKNAVNSNTSITLNTIDSATTNTPIAPPENNSDMSDRNNPIDNYFYPKLENAQAEVDIRTLQDSYYNAWKTEFNNVISYLNKKCKYQQDKNQISTYVKRLQDFLDDSTPVIVTDWGDVYSMDPKDPNRNPYGNGTLSGINEHQAKIYRDACIDIINRNSDYKFIFVTAK